MKRIKFLKFENLKDIQDWAAQYDDFYIFKNNEHNMHFWRVTKAETFEEAEKLLKRNFNFKDIKDGYGGGMKYLDWWDKDCCMNMKFISIKLLLRN